MFASTRLLDDFLDVRSICRMTTRRIAIVLAAVGVAGCRNARPITEAPETRLNSAKAAVERIRADDILRDVSYLASDANMGRRTPFPGSPSPGYDSAAAYVAKQLRELGVTPMGDDGTYYQHYTVTRSTLDTANVSGAVGAEPLVWGDDFSVDNFLVPGVREANVIYVGNGMRLLKQGVDPYAGFDIKGKWLLVHRPAPGAGRGGRGGGPVPGVVGIDY